MSWIFDGLNIVGDLIYIIAYSRSNPRMAYCHPIDKVVNTRSFILPSLLGRVDAQDRSSRLATVGAQLWLGPQRRPRARFAAQVVSARYPGVGARGLAANNARFFFLFAAGIISIRGLGHGSSNISTDGHVGGSGMWTFVIIMEHINAKVIRLALLTQGPDVVTVWIEARLPHRHGAGLTSFCATVDASTVLQRRGQVPLLLLDKFQLHIHRHRIGSTVVQTHSSGALELAVADPFKLHIGSI